jgi:hypothetical protein
MTRLAAVIESGDWPRPAIGLQLTACRSDSNDGRWTKQRCAVRQGLPEPTTLAVSIIIYYGCRIPLSHYTRPCCLRQSKLTRYEHADTFRWKPASPSSSLNPSPACLRGASFRTSR